MIQAVPTVILVLILHFYLKAMLFKPLAKLLAERDALTKGAREKAEASLKIADEKAAQYEKSLRDARTELYKEQEAARKQWIDDQNAQAAQAKLRGEALLAAAREQILKDTGEARQTLTAQSSELADQIANSILGKSRA